MAAEEVDTMLRELTADAVVDSFKKELRSMKFADSGSYSSIEKYLDTLVGPGKKRHEKTEVAISLWKLFVAKSLGSLTDNLRGYADLCRYFDKFVSYEDLLFAVDEKHRDHVIHSVWVMLLGFYLRKHFLTWKTINYENVIPVKSKSIPPKAKKKAGTAVDAVRRKEDALWCLIALTHDLGYPMQKTRMANEKMAEMISNFGFLVQRDFQYNFGVVHQTAIVELLKIISSSTIWLNHTKYKIGQLSGIRLDYAKSFERLDHGIMGAFLMLKYMDWIPDVMMLPEGVPEYPLKDYRKCARQVIVIILLRAISAHTNRNIYWKELGFFEALLFLSDELDEFSRYSRSRTSGEWIDSGCRTEFESTKKGLRIIYTLDNKDTEDNLCIFFREKLAAIHNRIELTDNNVSRLCLTCKDVRVTPANSFTYEKSVARFPTGIIKKNRSKTSHDIQGFLNGSDL